MLNRIDRPALLLLYHRVTNLGLDPQSLSVKPDHFYEQIDFLKKNYSLLTVEEFCECFTRRKKLPPKSVVLTFDDGYADNYHEALPILESLKAQALFYITTSNLDTDKELWWDELERILLGPHSLPDSIETLNAGETLRFPTSSSAERSSSYNSLHPYLKYAHPEERNKMLELLRESAGIGPNGRETHRLMTTEELRHLSNSHGAVIGAHTINHPSLSVLSYKQQWQEIAESKRILETMLNNNILHFSYPYGSKKDYNADTVEICRQLGFKMVCSNYFGQVHSWTNRFEIPRVLVRDWNGQLFSEYMTKFFKY